MGSNEQAPDTLLDDIEAFCDAALDGDYDLALQLGRRIPLCPETAETTKKILGKEGILRMGWDLSLVKERFGEKWIDEPVKL